MVRSSSPAQFAPHFRDHILEVSLGAVPFTNEAVQIVRARRGHGLCRELRGKRGRGNLGSGQEIPRWDHLPARQKERTLSGFVYLGVSE